MTAINIKAFKGKVPRTSPRLLDGNFATEALNAKLTSGRLDFIKGPALVHTSLAASIATMFRYRNGGADYWLVWPRTVDAVRSPTAQDALGRLYWSGDGEPRMSTFADAISGGGPYPAAWHVLGVYAPVTAPALAVVGGAGTTEDRSYVYTFKTALAEESGPSPAVVASGFQSGSWNLSGMEVAPPNAGTISGATSPATGVVRLTVDTTRGLSAYEEVTHAGVAGMTDLNGTFAISAIVDATHYEVALNTAQVYTAGGTWTRRAPHNVTGMVKRIYRTVGTNADYKLVAEIPAANTTYNDTVAATALGAGLATLASFPPPKNGHSMVALANGAHALLAGNELCISEQYKPYSYPLTNRYAFDGTGVALVAAGNSLIVMRSEGKPRVYAATVPEAATGADLPTSAPCISKAGVIDAGGYALCPSHDGLYAISPSDVRNVTDKLFRQGEWKAMNPETFKAAWFDQSYYAVRTEGAGKRVLVLDLAELENGVREIADNPDAIYVNPFDGNMYLGKTNKVYQFDADDTNRYLAFWQSPDFQMGPPLNFTCAQVHAEYGQIVPPDTTVQAANDALLASGFPFILGAFGDPTGMVPWGATNLDMVPSQSANRVQFSLVKDGVVMYSKDLDSSAPFRLPAKGRAEKYAIQIAASIPVYAATVAQSMVELGGTSQ